MMALPSKDEVVEFLDRLDKDACAADPTFKVRPRTLENLEYYANVLSEVYETFYEDCVPMAKAIVSK